MTDSPNPSQWKFHKAWYLIRRYGKKEKHGNAKSKQPRHESSSGNHKGPYNRGSHTGQTDRIQNRRIIQRDVDNSDPDELNQGHSGYQISKHPDKGELYRLTEPPEYHDQHQHTTTTPGTSIQSSANGRSGGLVLMWKDDMFNITDISITPQSIRVDVKKIDNNRPRHQQNHPHAGADHHRWVSLRRTIPRHSSTSQLQNISRPMPKSPLADNNNIAGSQKTPSSPVTCLPSLLFSPPKFAAALGNQSVTIAISGKHFQNFSNTTNSLVLTALSLSPRPGPRPSAPSPAFGAVADRRRRPDPTTGPRRRPPLPAKRLSLSPYPLSLPRPGLRPRRRRRPTAPTRPPVTDADPRPRPSVTDADPLRRTPVPPPLYPPFSVQTPTPTPTPTPLLRRRYNSATAEARSSAATAARSPAAVDPSQQRNPPAAGRHGAWLPAWSTSEIW
ncbi:verprolin-like [Capsicum annuum]|uniref:verprolin-like n=1 Tax=Capsicum annuum TaxID=4072 RepID=UPI001FB13BA6|nr:verprolin-like [Capsicum annuum]